MGRHPVRPKPHEHQQQRKTDMSAFFVSRQTIHDDVTAWAYCQPQPRSMDTLNTIGRQLWLMNAEAMQQRYPQIVGTEEQTDYLGSAAAHVYFPPRNITLAQMAKSVCCLSYQCCEGDVPETWPAFKTLEQIATTLGEPRGYDAAQSDREHDCAA
jgi:predicted aldo/keto reductase-like oxidoreductase